MTGTSLKLAVADPVSEAIEDNVVEELTVAAEAITLAAASNGLVVSETEPDDDDDGPLRGADVIDPVRAPRRSKETIVVAYEALQGPLLAIASEEAGASTAAEEAKPKVVKEGAPGSAGMSDAVPVADVAVADAEAAPASGGPSRRRRKAEAIQTLKELQATVQKRAFSALFEEGGRARSPVIQPYQLDHVFVAEGAVHDAGGKAVCTSTGGITQVVCEMFCDDVGLLDRSLQVAQKGFVGRLVMLKPHEDFVVGSRFHSEALFQAADEHFASCRAHASMPEAEYDQHDWGLLKAVSNTVAIWIRYTGTFTSPITLPPQPSGPRSTWILGGPCEAGDDAPELPSGAMAGRVHRAVLVGRR